MKVYVREREMRTAGGLTVSDITAEVEEAVAASGVVNGLACVYTPHTTCCIRINEWESGLFDDFIQLARSLAPLDRYYAHDDWERRTENVDPREEEPNGHAHCLDAHRRSERDDSAPGRRPLPRELPARDLRRARSRARSPLVRSGDRRVGRPSGRPSAARRRGCGSPAAPPSRAGSRSGPSRRRSRTGAGCPSRERRRCSSRR
jgi:thiamine phosphate synthase YjbQ (UPF0047 family)